MLVVQHARDEGSYVLGEALEAAGLHMRLCQVWAGDPVPETLTDVDALVVRGGPQAAYSDDGFPSRQAELDLLRKALAAEVPVLGICLGAQLLAVAAGGAARPGRGPGPQAAWAEVDLSPDAGRDPLFAGTSRRLWVLHWHGDTVDVPAEAVVLASCDRYPVQAFRVGGAAWGMQFHVEVDAAVEAFVEAFPQEAATAPGLREAAPAELAALAAYRGRVFARFAALVAERSELTAQRAFFTPRADAWEARFPADGPRYAAAVARVGLSAGQTALDLGCGTGRALPALRAAVGDKGVVLGMDVTVAMLRAAAREGRESQACLLVADCQRLPLPPGSVEGVFSAGLLDHVPAPAAALREWARVTALGGVLLLFHPSGRAERAARHGRPLSPDDPLGEPNLRPMLEAGGWQLDCYEDARAYFLARAVRGR